MTDSKSAAQAKHYYTEGLAREGYYLKETGQERIGAWHGQAGAMLGLQGRVTQRAFFALAENLHPDTDLPLTPKTRDNRRVGMDMTFSAPKAVALLSTLFGDDRKRKVDVLINDFQFFDTRESVQTQPFDDLLYQNFRS